jgi:hypothetical protein
VFAHLHPEDFGAVTPEMIQDARFSVNYSFPKAGQGTTLRYFIEKDGKPVADLETYLAALMHLAVIKTDHRYFIHAHGEAPGSPSAHPAGHIHGAALNGFGPFIEANVTFPVKGIYQIFSEIKHQGKVIVTSFMVKVE